MEKNKMTLEELVDKMTDNAEHYQWQEDPRENPIAICSYWDNSQKEFTFWEVVND